MFIKKEEQQPFVRSFIHALYVVTCLFNTRSSRDSQRLAQNLLGWAGIYCILNPPETRLKFL